MEKLRKKIKIAARQLKPYKDEADYNLIILGKKSGYDLDLNFLKWAMWGDPVIRVPIYPVDHPRGKPYFDMKVKGALRKNDPINKQMYFPHEYISGIGLIKKFNGLSYYKNLLYEKYIKRDIKNFRSDLSKALDFFNFKWKKYSNEIPKNFIKEPKKFVYKIEIVSNPFATYPLPKTIFDGTWDEFATPKVIYSKDLR